MLFRSLQSLLLLPAAIRAAAISNTTSSGSRACNNSPNLCSKAYNQVTYLGAHDSPFVANASNDYTASGNQYYTSTAQLSAGVRLLSAQVQLWGAELHVCHTECALYDAGPLSDWLGEVKSWMDSNPNEVVTILLVNGAAASATQLGAQYEKAGITSTLAYTPNGSTSGAQKWPTLESMINSGTRLVNFVASVSYDSTVPYIMDEWTYIFENNYDVSSLTGFSCEANRPSNVAGDTATAIQDGMLPLMNHFLYADSAFGIQTPNVSEVAVTNSPKNITGSLGASATECTQYYGRIPGYVLVDYFNEGPAIETVDRLNDVTNPVGRTAVSRGKPAATSGASSIMTGKGWMIPWSASLTALLVNSML